jgi:hypothetical protein
VPEFGPEIPNNGIFKKNAEFQDFIFTKMINGQIASLNHPTFRETIWCRPKEAFLRDLVKSLTKNKTILNNLKEKE